MTMQAMIAGVCYYWVILTRLQPDYTAEDTRTGGIDNYLSCYNTDSDYTVHPSAHIHRYLEKKKISSTGLGQDNFISVYSTLD